MQMNEVLKQIVDDLVLRKLAECSADAFNFVSLSVLLALRFMRFPCRNLMLAGLQVELAGERRLYPIRVCTHAISRVFA